MQALALTVAHAKAFAQLVLLKQNNFARRTKNAQMDKADCFVQPAFFYCIVREN